MSDIRVYSVRVATLYGPDCATFINHLQYRIGENRSEGRYFYDGRYWTYNSTNSLIERLYPYWSQDQMDRIIKKLVDAGVILIGNYNKMPGDRTRWYAFVDENKFLGPKTGREIKLQEDTSSNENAGTHQEPKNQNLSPQTVGAVHSAKTRNVEPQGFQPVVCLKTVGTNQVMRQDIDEDQSVKTHLGAHKGFQGDLPPQTVITHHSAKTRDPFRENHPPIPLINFNKKEREVALEKSASPSLKDSENVLKEKKGRGSRLSPTWELPDADREWGLKRGLFNEHIDIQAERFRDHWISTTKNPTKVDWSATWRNWLRGAKDVSLNEPISSIKIEPPKPTIKNSSDPKIQKWYDSRGEGLDSKYGSGVWKSWFEPLVLVSLTKDEAVFKAPTRWMATEIKRRFIDGIFQSLKRIDPEFGISSASVRHPEENAIRITYNE